MKRRQICSPRGAIVSLSITIIVFHILLTIKILYVNDYEKQCPSHYNQRTLDCDCERNFSSTWEIQSSCDYYSTARGRHQKVVSYSFFGNTSSIYFQGIEQSAINVANFYPGWVMRLYHNIDTSDPKQNSALCKLWCKYDHLDICDVTRLPFPLCDQSAVAGAIWRFFPMGDPVVDIFIVRDIDSPIIQREVDAVQYWIRRNKTYHVMRDHLNHACYILGGMWGAFNRNVKFMEEIRGEFITEGINNGERGQDQILLREILYPRMTEDLIAHDSYLCNIFHDSIAFPTRRENFTYVGMIYEWRSEFNMVPEVCPEDCRPNEHLDWEYC